MELLLLSIKKVEVYVQIDLLSLGNGYPRMHRDILEMCIIIQENIVASSHSYDSTISAIRVLLEVYKHVTFTNVQHLTR